MREGSEPGHDSRENLEAWLTGSQGASLVRQNLLSRDTFMLVQNIDHIIFVFGCVFHVLLLILISGNKL